ncbi:60S acidic ribosomal protein P1 [Escherichia coli]|nr:60S acidic ribosomal protein P1 [Escherichia coli]
MASEDELACVYAALILADDQVAITAEKISTLLKAANVSVEPYWPTLFAKALDGMNIKDLVSNVGSGAGAAPAAATTAPAASTAPAAAAAGKAPAAEAKKEKEESEESDGDPTSFLAMLRVRIVLAILIMSSIVKLPLCLMFFVFLRSRGGSLSALMIREAALGTTSTRACLFWTISLTVIFRPFQSDVALAMSSPTFLGDRPKGPILGARAEVAGTSPPTARQITSVIAVGSNLGGILTLD